VRLELAALDHGLQQCGDLAFFTIEHVENLAPLVPSPFNLGAKIQETQGNYDRRHDGYVFEHETASIERGEWFGD
jgi:hypothetical protein